ncbi:MAG: ZIP family metal transporter [Candidatus Aenigmatarchaeota archaeon]
MAWLYTLLSVILVSLISFVGVLTISLNMERLKKVLLYLVSFAAGGLLGGAFIHLIPEAVGEFGMTASFSLYLLGGIVLFFILEKFICWRHCHHPTTNSHPHPFAYMNLLGDGVHNFIDGLIIAASYLVSIPLGVATTIAVILHEIPQEIGDFGVLVHGGFSRKRALGMNFLTALTAVAGAVVVLLLGAVEGLGAFLLPLAAGGFIYIAGSDLIPELHKEMSMRKSGVQLLFIVLGIAIMYLLTLVG